MALSDGEAAAAAKAAPRFAAWWKNQEPGKPLDSRIKYVKHLSKWLHERGWIEAAKLPLPTEKDAVAELMAGKVDVNKWRQPALFAACELERGRPAPVGSKGTVIEAAKKRLGSGAGPP